MDDLERTKLDHLFDTSSIIKGLKNTDILKNVINSCLEQNSHFTVSDIIISELNPPENWKHSRSDDYHLALIQQHYLQYCINNQMVRHIIIAENHQIKHNYSQIRSRYYSWMSDPNFCRRLISKGILTIEDVKSPGFKNKDRGECSLIAIALTSPESYIIVTEDYGRVFGRPNINIFTEYEKQGIKVTSYSLWKDIYLKDTIEC